MKVLIALAKDGDITETPQFKAWFKQSKCVRAGKPRILYHSTRAQFTVFDLRYTTGQLGFHLGTLPQARSVSRSTSRSGRVYMHKVYASIQNPIRLEDMGGWHGYEVRDMVNRVAGLDLKGSGRDSDIRRALIAAGYDGVVYKNKFEGSGDSFIAFYPNQIKSITNTTFDPNSQDINE
jgi:hypothetical protein